MTPHDAPLAVTMGDPSGIGPEIIAKMYLRRPDKRHWIVVGDPLVMTHALGALDADGALLLADDIADGVAFDYGQIHFPNRLGTGAILR